MKEKWILVVSFLSASFAQASDTKNFIDAQYQHPVTFDVYGHYIGKIKPEPIYEPEPVYKNAQEEAKGLVQRVTMPDEVVAYKDLYEKISQSTERQSLASLYEAGENVVDAFDRMDSRRLPIYEDLKYPETSKLFTQKMAEKIPGYNMGIGLGGTILEIDGEAYLDFAQKHGLQEDVDFFTLYQKTFPDGMILSTEGPILECTNLEHEIFVYKGWQPFLANARSEVYKKFANDNISFGVSYYFNMCSCDSKEKTLKSLHKISKLLHNDDENVIAVINIIQENKLVEDSESNKKLASEVYRFNGQCNY